MNKMLSYFKAYSFVRWVRLIVGLVVITEAFRTGEFVVSLIGFTLIFMAWTKAGCDPSTNSCPKPLN
jgi:hypothetical protein